MTTDELEDKERIARELGWESFDAAPKPVQNNIENREIKIPNPHGILRPEGN